MKILFGIITVIALATSCTTNHVTEYPYRAPQTYYYYPSANVYYDGGRSCYIYNNGHSWITAAVLPYGFSIGNDRVQVYYNGSEVWRDNERHRSLYYRQPVVVNERRYDDHRNNDKRWRKERRREERQHD
jgi:hypothetical protein